MWKKFCAALLLMLLLPACALAEVVISEIMTSNGTYENGHAYDWIELHNAGEKAVSLSGWSLMPESEPKKLYCFSSDAMIPAGGYLVVYCDGGRSVGGELHARFSLVASGAAVTLLEEYYSAGRDLAAVFDQMLGLIRDALLVKTSRTDVSALISPAYTVKTLQGLCDGLAASTLIAWSRIIGDSLDRMRSAANRRVEAELCAVRLCSLGAENYDTLGGRVEALEEKLKNGVPVQVVQTPQSGGMAPPPPRDEDAPPPPGDEDAPPLIDGEPAPQAKSGKPAGPTLTLWPQWARLLDALMGKINVGALTNIKLGAENMHWKESGAYTGELSAAMLKESGVEYVILGHSERRQYFAETDQTVNKRALAALNAGLKVIICVGESLQQREEGVTEELVRMQTKIALRDVTAEQMANVVIAYEPIWAIGTGKTATADQAEEVCAQIRKVIGEVYGEAVAEAVTVQYGGSMNAKNCEELLSKKDVDGGLIGGASLKAPDFAVIVNAASNG